MIPRPSVPYMHATAAAATTLTVPRLLILFYHRSAGISHRTRYPAKSNSPDQWLLQKKFPSFSLLSSALSFHMVSHRTSYGPSSVVCCIVYCVIETMPSFLHQMPAVRSQGATCTASSVLTVCMALPLHASTFSTSGDCTLLSNLVTSQSGSGSFTWPPSSARSYSCGTTPSTGVSSSINSPNPFYFACASGITSASAYSRLMSQVWALGINSVFVSNLIKSYTRNGIRTTAIQLWVWFSCKGSTMPSDPTAANAVGNWALRYYQAGSVLSPPPPRKFVG